jgi:hypothetical protein
MSDYLEKSTIETSSSMRTNLLILSSHFLFDLDFRALILKQHSRLLDAGLLTVYFCGTRFQPIYAFLYSLGIDRLK